MKNGFISALMIISVLLAGYMLGRNDTELKYYHPVSKSEYKEINSYRMCMQDKTCLMFVRAKQ